MVDAETGATQEVTFGRYRMKAYQLTVQNYIQRLREFCQARGINFFTVTSNTSLSELLLKQLAAGGGVGMKDPGIERMNFLAPAAFLFAAAIPVVVVFYLLKRKRVVRLVSSTVLWQKFLAETQASAPFQKLRQQLAADSPNPVAAFGYPRALPALFCRRH